MKEFILTQRPNFRLRVTAHKCSAPKDLYSLDFIQEHINKNQEVTQASTYNFFITEDEIKTLAHELSKI